MFRLCSCFKSLSVDAADTPQRARAVSAPIADVPLPTKSNLVVPVTFCEMPLNVCFEPLTQYGERGAYRVTVLDVPTGVVVTEVVRSFENSTIFWDNKQQATAYIFHDTEVALQQALHNSALKK